MTKLKRDTMYAGHKSKNGYALLEVSNYMGLVTSSYLVQHDSFVIENCRLIAPFLEVVFNYVFLMRFKEVPCKRKVYLTQEALC